MEINPPLFSIHTIKVLRGTVYNDCEVASQHVGDTDDEFFGCALFERGWCPDCDVALAECGCVEVAEDRTVRDGLEAGS